MRFWGGLYLLKYASFGVFCWLWALRVMLHVFNFMQLSNAIMLLVVQICCTFFLVLFRSVGPFLHFCTGFYIGMLCLSNVQILRVMCLTDGEICLLACWCLSSGGGILCTENKSVCLNSKFVL